jgi:peptidoglycan glycosyltransferase
MIGDMNARMARVFVGLALAFGGIVLMLTWWQILDAGSLRRIDYNNQTAYYQQRIKRGRIYSSDGVPLAVNRMKHANNGDTIYTRFYPHGKLAAHVVGYSTVSKNRTGVERTHNDVLTGSQRSLAPIIDRIKGSDVVRGDNVYLTINARAQKVAERALAGRKGAVVALDPSTGAVLVMASSPSYSLNLVEHHFDQITKGPKGDARLLNRATLESYAPGSTFKVVTATAALESGDYTPDTKFPGGTSVEVDSGPPVQNFGGESFGPHNFTFALTNSINTTFARIGDDLGTTRLRAQMRKFGFDSTPPLDDLPRGELRASGLYSNGRILGKDEPTDAARVAIGQERLAVTPLQMALVSAAVANNGVIMRPYLVQKTTTPDGRVTETAEPRQWKVAMSTGTAADLTEMMSNVVRDGTAAGIGLDQIHAAGKTGTADTATGNQVWLIAFAPADHPRVAIAATIAGQPSGATGGVVAGPIARDVMISLLKGRRR